jgi:hypothetical protein
MERLSNSDSSALPGSGVLILCAAILFAGYIAAAMRPAIGPVVATKGVVGER